jgi:hypothetical protein
LVLGWGAFAFGLRLFNATKARDETTEALPLLLLLPFLIQIVWFSGAAFFSHWSKRREPILGILLGFGIEIVLVLLLVVFASSAHY